MYEHCYMYIHTYDEYSKQFNFNGQIDIPFGEKRVAERLGNIFYISCEKGIIRIIFYLELFVQKVT